jgi:anti-sigma factor RsiW
MKEVNAPGCGRENDLISFLYGELSAEESQTFNQHVRSCHSCKTELASFQDVRQAVVAWRNESLGVAAMPVATPSVAEQRTPSALAAFREFFNLSPLWLKGAVAFASILFCLVAGLAIARLRTSPPPVIVTNTPSTEQLNALVEQRVQKELQRIKEASQPSPAEVAVVKNEAPSPRRVTNRVTDPVQQARRPLSRTEREQLAADLRLVSARNESELDLLDDGINQ